MESSVEEVMIEVKGLSFAYENQVRALNHINFTIAKGEKIALVGPNGSGKSTLFLCLNGVLKPQEGSICYCGMPISYSKKELLNLRSKVGIVFQDPDNQLFSASVMQEISFGPCNLLLEPTEVKARVEEVMNVLHIEHLKDRPTHYLSGGEKKRITIADILVMKPEVILFDEPVSALDPKHTEIVYGILEKLSSYGITILISTHDIDHAYAWADRVLVFQEGNLLGEGTAVDIFTNDRLLQIANLKKPSILGLYDRLVSEKILTSQSNIPRNSEDLVEEIKKQIFLKNAGESDGREGVG